MRSSSDTTLGPTPADASDRRPLERLLVPALGLLAVGMQTGEGLCTAGFVLLLLSTVGNPGVWSDRRWRWLWAWMAWALVVPLAAGRLPTGTGIARLADWLALPAAAWGFARIPVVLRRRLVAVAAVTLVVSCVCAGLQHYGLWPAPERLAWTHVRWDRVYEPAPGAPGRFMGGGLLAHRLKFAHVGGLVVLALAVAGTVDRTMRRWSWAAAAVGFVSIWLFPLARMAAVALTLALALVAVAMSQDRRRALLLASCGVVVALASALSVPAVRERFSRSLESGGSGGNGDRAALLASGLAAVRQHPLAGVGLDRFRHADWVAQNAPETARKHSGKAHQQVVTIAAEQGIPAALLLVVFLAGLVLAGMRTRAGTAAAVLVAYFSCLSLAHDPLFHAPFSMGLAALLGMALGASRADRLDGAGADAR